MKRRKAASIGLFFLAALGLTSCDITIPGACVYGPPPYESQQSQIIIMDGDKITKEINFSQSCQINLDDYNKDPNYELLGLYYPDGTIYKGERLYESVTFTLKKREINAIDKGLFNLINSLINTDYDYYIPRWNKESYKGKWNYIDGVFLKSLVSISNYYQYKNNKRYNDYTEFIKMYVDAYIAFNGSFVNLKDSTKPGYTSGELDTVCESMILGDVRNYTNDNYRYAKAIEITLDELYSMPKCSGTINYCHKTIYENQIWLDGMYMYAPFITRYGTDSDREDLITQYKYIRDNMFDEDKKLYYHGHDTTKSIFWSDSKTGNSNSFWLRAEGWYITSLVDVLEYYPEGENKEYLKSLLKEALDGVLQYKDNDTNMFYQLIDQGNKSFVVPNDKLESLKNTKYQVNGKYVDTEISNYLESSGSSMIAYSLMKASRLGYISTSYKELGEKIYEGVYNHSFINNELNDICITAGLGPDGKEYRDGSPEYYLAEPVGSNDAKGVGPFIMAYTEYIQK